MTSNARELAQIPSTPSGRRNIVINGAMNVAQRGTSSSGKTSGGYYATDRWGITIDNMGTWTISQETDAPDGSGLTNSTKFLCTTADASPASGDASICFTRFEGQDLQFLEKGTSAAKSVTVSFWVKSSTTGTYILELYDNDNARHINKSYTINSSATWEKKEITFAGDTNSGDTFGNDANLSLIVNWWLGAGSAYQSGTLATSWQEYATADRVVGQVNVAGANNNYFQITGVQLEVGSVATEFEHRSYGEELALCPRYYYMAADGSINSESGLGASYGHSDTSSRFTIDFPVTMRAVPSLDSPTVTDAYRFVHGATSSSTTQLASSLTLPYANWNTTHRMLVGQTGLTDNNSGGKAGYVQIYNSSTAYVAFDAEL